MYVKESINNKLEFNKEGLSNNTNENSNTENNINGFSCSSVILDDINSFYGKQISERLSYKIGTPIYLSFNIPDEFVDLELKIRLETGLYDYIKAL
jgi:hypothetical protein